MDRVFLPVDGGETHANEVDGADDEADREDGDHTESLLLRNLQRVQDRDWHDNNDQILDCVDHGRCQ